MRQKRAFKITVAISLVFVVALGAVVLAATPVLDRWVLGGGGGRVTAGNYTLDATMGQSVTGVVSDSPYELCTGFLCGAGRWSIYLPLVLRG